jgi:hypothetical protein
VTPFQVIVQIAKFKDYFATVWLFTALTPDDQMTLAGLEVIWLTKAKQLSTM